VGRPRKAVLVALASIGSTGFAAIHQGCAPVGVLERKRRPGMPARTAVEDQTIRFHDAVNLNDVFLVAELASVRNHFDCGPTPCPALKTTEGSFWSHVVVSPRLSSIHWNSEVQIGYSPDSNNRRTSSASAGHQSVRSSTVSSGSFHTTTRSTQRRKPSSGASVTRITELPFRMMS
jgi:hypothetical protein